MKTETRNYHSKASRLTDALLRDLAERDFAAENFLPPEEVLVEHYQASRYTIRRTIDNLIESGALSRHGSRRLRINRDHLGFTAASPKTTFTLAWAAAAVPDTMICNTTEGIKKYATEHNLQLHMLHSVEGHEPVLSSLTQCINLGIDGVIVLPYLMPEYNATLKRLADAGLPLVTIAPLEGVNASSVCGDDFSGTFVAVHRMLEKHDRPVYYLGAYETSSGLIRRQAFRQAMRETGFEAETESHLLSLPPNGLYPEYWPMEAKWSHLGKTIEENIIDRLAFPACVMCENDYAAYGLYQAAQKRGLAIGRDLFVCGFDDIPMARRMDPPLSTVRIDTVAVGYQAARVLHQKMAGEVTEPVHLKIPSEFIERESS